MSTHGSDASQGSHVLESLLAFSVGTLIWPGGTVSHGILAGLMATLGKELPQMYAKVDLHWWPPSIGTREGLRGDFIDTAVHLATIALAALIYALTG